MEAIIDNEVLCDVITEIKIFVEIHFEISYKYDNLNIVEYNWNARIILIERSNNKDYLTIITMFRLCCIWSLDNQEWGLIWYLICLLPVICLLRVLSIYSMEDMFFGTCRVMLVVSNILGLDVINQISNFSHHYEHKF